MSGVRSRGFESRPRYIADGDLKALRLEGFRLLEGLRDAFGDGRTDLDPPLDLVELGFGFQHHRLHR